MKSDGFDDAHLVEHGLSSTTLLEGGFLHVVRDEVRLPDGSRATREYIRHPGAVAIIPMLDDGRLVMVRQYRFPLARVMLEFPAGKIEPGEPQLDCARRELAEETGYVAREWAFAGEINNAPAYSNESIWLWFARGLVPGATRLDVGEFVETVTLSLEELEAIDLAGQLADVKTLIGMHWLRQWRSGLRAAAWQIEPHVQAAR